MVSSKPWPSNIQMNGMFDDNATANPNFHCANHVFLPYCTSDSWSGDKAASARTMKIL
jgi:hypothetical protein